MVLGKRLKVLTNKTDSSGAGLPRVDQVLYAHSNPDASRKSCSNCMLWIRTNQCAIHAQHIEILPEAICGYHVYGQPLDEYPNQGQDPVEPELSGLTIVAAGTSCDTCRWYEPRGAGGLCNAVIDETGSRARVEALGCCTRWEDA